MSKARQKILSLGLLLPIFLLNISSGLPEQCHPEARVKPTACCEEVSMMTVGAGERFANTPCGCSLSQEPDATEGRTIATLAESLNGKNGHKYSNFSQCIHGDPREPGFSTTPCFGLLQTKPGTRTKLYTLNSSFLI